MNVDNWLQRIVAVNPGLVGDLAQAVTLLGDPVIVLLIVVGVTWRRWMPMSVCISGSFAARVIYSLLKEMISRERPDAALQVVRASGYAMPSGHAAGIAFVAAVVVVMHPRWRVLAVTAAAVVGWSRVALGVHYPSDVFVGWALGGALGYLCARLATRLEGGTIRVR